MIGCLFVMLGLLWLQSQLEFGSWPEMAVRGGCVVVFMVVVTVGFLPPPVVSEGLTLQAEVETLRREVATLRGEVQTLRSRLEG